MSTLTVTNIKATGETASRAVSGVAAAWCSLNGTGTAAINDSENVSSVTDNGTGDYTYLYSSALANSNYNFTASGDNPSGATWILARSTNAANGYQYNASGLRLTFVMYTPVQQADTTKANTTIHGDLA